MFPLSALNLIHLFNIFITFITFIWFVPFFSEPFVVFFNTSLLQSAVSACVFAFTATSSCNRWSWRAQLIAGKKIKRQQFVSPRYFEPRMIHPVQFPPFSQSATLLLSASRACNVALNLLKSWTCRQTE